MNTIKPLEITDKKQYDEYLNTHYNRYCAHLQAWYMENQCSETMIYAKAFGKQFCFVRDESKRIFRDLLSHVNVISTHTSKSIKMPVYHIVLTNGASLIIRDNFHGWKISVDTNYTVTGGLNIPISLLEDGIDEQIASCYCEGFEKNWVYEPYKVNNNKFTVGLGSEYEVWTFLFLIAEQFNK